MAGGKDYEGVVANVGAIHCEDTVPAPSASPTQETPDSAASNGFTLHSVMTFVVIRFVMNFE